MNEIFKKQNALKVCGITTKDDAYALVDMRVEALGFNFWPKSKRYISAENALAFSPQLENKIVRVGVFVNQDPEEILQLLRDNVIDIAQLHGDESFEYCQAFAKHGFPFIKAIGVANADSLDRITDYHADAILLDAHAPLVYGGTGDTFDWNLAKDVMVKHPDLPIILAGGITAENAGLAAKQVVPCILDVASGAEVSPGVKDFDKVKAMQEAIYSANKA